MTRITGFAFVLLVVLLAAAFAAGNADHRATLNLGLLTLYRVPVTLVAFSGLMVGMLVMFAAGVHSDLRVRRILRERLAREAEEEQKWIDRNQQDLFAQDLVPEVPQVAAGSPLSHPETDNSEVEAVSIEDLRPEADPTPDPADPESENPGPWEEPATLPSEPPAVPGVSAPFGEEEGEEETKPE
jgi:uncharacterized integral membrane protein